MKITSAFFAGLIIALAMNVATPFLDNESAQRVFVATRKRNAK